MKLTEAERLGITSKFMFMFMDVMKKHEGKFDGLTREQKDYVLQKIYEKAIVKQAKWLNPEVSSEELSSLIETEMQIRFKDEAIKNKDDEVAKPFIKDAEESHYMEDVVEKIRSI